MAKPPTFTSTLEEVANLALGMIGEAKKDYIEDLDTVDTVIGDAVLQHIYVVIRDVQSEFRWEELITRELLTTPEDITDNQAYDWAYRYALPDNYLMPLWYDETDHVIEGGYVYCDTPDDYRFHYVGYSIDPLVWSPQLLVTIKHRLAMALTVPLGDDAGTYTQLLTEYERIILPRAERLSSYAKVVPNKRRSRGRTASIRGRV